MTSSGFQSLFLYCVGKRNVCSLKFVAGATPTGLFDGSLTARPVDLKNNPVGWNWAIGRGGGGGRSTHTITSNKQKEIHTC